MIITRSERGPSLGFGTVFFLVTCVLEFLGDDISAADVKQMIWKFQNAGVIFIYSYV